jgi:4-amino-4-deoxy-L-arabinose transferase-like glycosyltransferase
MHNSIPIAPVSAGKVLRSFYFYALVIVILAGAILRFYRISDRGIFIHDEAHFASVVRTYGDALGWLWKNRAELRSGTLTPADARAYLVRRGGSLFGTAKEGHIAAQALFSLIYGLRPTTGPVLSGIFGAATLLLIFALGARTSGVPAGLLAAASLASSAMFLKYSRSGLAQADSIFFAYLAVLLYLLSREKKSRRTPFLALAGLSLGVAFTCHYNIVWILAVLVCAELFFPLRGSIHDVAPRRPAIAALWLVAAFALYLVLFDIPFEAAKIALRGAYPGFLSYFGDLRYHVLKYHIGSRALGASATRLVFDDPLFFVRLFVSQEGIAAALLLACAFIVFVVGFLRERRCERFILILIFIIPLLWSFYSFRVERSFIVMLPAAALIFGQVVALLMGRLPVRDGARQIGVLGVVMILLLSGWFKAQENVLPERTNFRDGARLALDYALGTRGMITERSFSWHAAPIWKFYLAYDADRRADHVEAWRQLNLGSAEEANILLLDAITRGDVEFMQTMPQSRVVATVPATPNPRPVVEIGTIFICDTRGQIFADTHEVRR